MFVLRSTFNKQKDLLDKAYEDLEDKTRTIKQMADVIRNMDTLVFQMSQKTSWAEQQPYFAQLQAGMEKRRRQESDRINSILQTELLSVYTKDSQ